MLHPRYKRGRDCKYVCFLKPQNRTLSFICCSKSIIRYFQQKNSFHYYCKILCITIAKEYCLATVEIQTGKIIEIEKKYVFLKV